MVFVEANPELVTLLNQEGSYPLRLFDAYARREIDVRIRGVHALLPTQEEEVMSFFVESDVLGTAVGIQNYPHIAPYIARGIHRRREQGKPVDIYLCENDLEAHTRLKSLVASYLDESTRAWMEDHIGFVRVSVARMVAGRKAEVPPLLVLADAYREFPYDERARRSERVYLATLKPIYNFEVELQRKIYTYNLAHAALAYLGYVQGYRYVHEGFHDPWVMQIFHGALEETAQALYRAYPLDINPREHQKVLEDVRIRFGNPLLQDPIHRVARDPIRKLGPHDRLVGSALLCLAQDIFPAHIAIICAASLLYDWEGDPEALRLQEKIRREGVERTLEEITTLTSQDPLGQRILEEYDRLKSLRGRART